VIEVLVLFFLVQVSNFLFCFEVAPVQDDYSMPNLVDMSAELVTPLVRTLFGTQMQGMAMNRVCTAADMMVNAMTPSARPVDLLFGAAPLVNGAGSETNRVGQGEWNRQDWRYNMDYWGNQLCHRGAPPNRYQYIELAAILPVSLMIPTDRPAHQAQALVYGKAHGPFTKDGQYCKMTLWGPYAVCFVTFMHLPVCQMARRLGWRPLFALKKGLCNFKKVGKEGGPLEFRIVSVNLHGSSFLSLVGFMKQTSKDPADTLFIGVSNKGYPLTTRELQLGIQR
jgi:hypothetical protein